MYTLCLKVTEGLGQGRRGGAGTGSHSTALSTLDSGYVFRMPQTGGGTPSQLCSLTRGKPSLCTLGKSQPRRGLGLCPSPNPDSGCLGHGAWSDRVDGWGSEVAEETCPGHFRPTTPGERSLCGLTNVSSRGPFTYLSPCIPVTATSAPGCLPVSVGGVASTNAAWLSEYWGAAQRGVVEL